MYDLHAVIVKKPMMIDEAKKLASDYIKTRSKFYRETGDSYRFRNIPKTKFEPRSFRTKVINDKISLVYGNLKL